MGQNTGSSLRALLLTTVVSIPRLTAWVSQDWFEPLQLVTACTGAVVEKRQTLPVVSGYAYHGCQTEATNGRALSSKSTAYDTMTLESCASDCAGYIYFRHWVRSRMVRILWMCAEANSDPQQLLWYQSWGWLRSRDSVRLQLCMRRQFQRAMWCWKPSVGIQERGGVWHHHS